MNSLILFKRKDSNGAGDERLIGKWLGGQAMATVRAIPPQYKELQLKNGRLLPGQYEITGADGQLGSTRTLL